MKLLSLHGDGIGPEIVSAAEAVLAAADRVHKLGLEIDHETVGFASLEQHGTTLRPEVLERAKSYDGLILGTQSHADYPGPEEGGINISASFRVGLDLYANVRPARTRDGLGIGSPGLDLVIMREATEGFYADRNMYRGWGEVMPDEDMALSIRKITAKACERIIRRAFELAMTRDKLVTAVHKANSFHMTDGLFLKWFAKVAEDFPEVQTEDILIDAMAAHLVRHPQRFDVVVTTNFYGDILSDLASELSGSLGLAGAVNAGDDLCCAQAQHGSAPDIAGQNKANPTSMILSVAMLLDWGARRLSRPELAQSARSIETAVDEALMDDDTRTPDLGGRGTTSAFTNAVVSKIEARG